MVEEEEIIMPSVQNMIRMASGVISLGTDGVYMGEEA
jgi:hypothetical protein